MTKQPTISSLNKTNVGVYDLLADEYEACAKANLDIVSESMDKLLRHITPPATALDVGCGVGNIADALVSKGYEVDGIDISPKMIEAAKRTVSGARFFVGDVYTYSFEKHYDIIVAFAFLHLFPKREVVKMLQKFREILKPGGFIYTGTTESSEYTEGYEYKHDYNKKVRRFRVRWPRNELDQFLVNNGFEIIEVYKHIDFKNKIWLDYLLKVKEL